VKAYTPTVASANTSSAVRQAPPITVGRSMLEGKMPLSSYGHGPQPTGNPHTASGPGAFAKPMHNYDSGQMKMAATHETRNAAVPHVSMHP
jgi:hypothetical protein